MAGTVRLRRRFHQPTGIATGDVVRLAFLGSRGKLVVRLDDQHLEPLSSEDATLVFEITTFLQPTNTLEVDLTCDPTKTDAPLGLYDFVAIEIVAAPADEDR